MTGFRRRTDALVHTVLVNAGLVPIPLFINAPDPQGAFAATLGQFTRNYTQTTKRGLLTTNKG